MTLCYYSLETGAKEVDLKITRSALVVSLVYCLLGVLWLLLSNSIVSLIIADSFADQAQLYKDWVFIGITALLIFFLVKNQVRNLIKAQAKLEESKKQLETILGSISDAVIAVDNRGVVYHMNPVAQQLTGWDQVSAKGKSYTDILNFIPTNGDEPEDILNLGETDSLIPRKEDVRLRSKNNIERDLERTCAWIRTKKGEVIGLVIVLRDVTSQRILGDRISTTQRMSAIENLSSSIAHDFNNILGKITGYSELLKTNTDASTPNHKYVENILASLEKAGELTEKLSSFSSSKTRMSMNFNVNDILIQCTKLLTSGGGKHQINIDLAASIDTVCGDPVLLRNAILNIAQNSKDAMKNGGEIAFSSRNVSLDHVFCKYSNFDISPGQHVHISIADTGEGIPHSEIEKIFVPFYTLKSDKNNSGLGLSQVYGTVKSHNGALTVYSEENRGTVFNIYLPICNHSIESASSNSSLHTPIPGEGKILVVDDDPIIRSMVKEMLEEIGYKVSTAENSVEGLKQFTIQKKELSLVLMDVVMPGMDGVECTKELRKLSTSIPILISSGFSRNLIPENLKELGANGFIRKPFRQVILSKAISDLLKGKDYFAAN